LLSEIARIAEELSIADSMTLVTHAHGVPIGLPPFAEDTLVRIAQEAMTNVIKHARAKTIQVNLIYDADQLTLRVEDDGCGFDVAAANDRDAGYGLLGMRERTEKLGGELTISSVRGSGTLIKVVVPTAKLAV
jgi:signal transduction histidine kinase